MNTKKHKFFIVILGFCLICLMGFKSHTSIYKEQSQNSVIMNEEIIVFREDDISYLVQNNGISHNLPMETMDRTSGNTEEYSEMVINIEERISYGIVKVDKVIKNKDLYYTLLNGETVIIKSVEDNHYIIIDSEGNEFKVKDTYVELSRVKEKVSRGSANMPSRGELVNKVITAAYKNLGKSYCHGGIGPNNFDCSGLTYSIYLNELGIELERGSRYQIENGFKVDRVDLIPGDIVFFKTSGKKIGHVGLYIGDNNMIHASSGRKRVMITNINTSDYYNTRYVTGRRIIK